MENNDEQLLEIFDLEQSPSGIMKISSVNGPVFYIRPEYLDYVDSERIRPGEKFDGNDAADIISAGFAFAAEKKAEDYLARCEQCRFGLERKLLQKEFEKSSIIKALDFLESKNYLSDARYASCWVRSHLAFKPQGRLRILKELLSRGISKSVADEAIEEYFSENDEEALCVKAFEKAVNSGKKGEKLLKFLIDSGFSYKMIQKVQN